MHVFSSWNFWYLQLTYLRGRGILSELKPWDGDIDAFWPGVTRSPKGMVSIWWCINPISPSNPCVSNLTYNTDYYCLLRDTHTLITHWSQHFCELEPSHRLKDTTNLFHFVKPPFWKCWDKDTGLESCSRIVFSGKMANQKWRRSRARETGPRECCGNHD